MFIVYNLFSPTRMWNPDGFLLSLFSILGCQHMEGTHQMFVEWMKVTMCCVMFWTTVLSFPLTLQILSSLRAQAVLPFVWSILRPLSAASRLSDLSSQLKCPPSQTLNIASPCIPVASFHIIYLVYRSLHTICLLTQGLLHNKTIISTLRGLVSPVHYSIYHPEHFWVPMCWMNEWTPRSMQLKRPQKQSGAWDQGEPRAEPPSLILLSPSAPSHPRDHSSTRGGQLRKL